MEIEEFGSKGDNGAEGVYLARLIMLLHQQGVVSVGIGLRLFLTEFETVILQCWRVK